MIAAEAFLFPLPAIQDENDASAHELRTIRQRMIRELHSILANVPQDEWHVVAAMAWSEALAYLAERARWKTRTTGKFSQLRTPTDPPLINFATEAEQAAAQANAENVPEGPLPTDDSGQVLFTRPGTDDLKPNQS